MLEVSNIQCRPTPLLWDDYIRDPRTVPGLGLYLDAYDVNGLNYLQGVSAWNDWSGNNRHASQGVGGNQPRMLPWDGRNYGHQSGASNGFTTPSSAANTFTDRLEIVIHVALNNWNPGLARGLVGKFTGGASPPTARAYALVTSVTAPTNRLAFSFGDGTTQLTAFSNQHSFVNGTAYWLRVRYIRDTGAGQYSVNFAWAASQPTRPSTWTDLGTATGTAIGDLAVGPALRVGSHFGLENSAPGQYYYVGLSRVFDAPEEVTFDPSRAHANSNTWVAATGETWTVNRSGANPARIVSAPAVLFDGTDDFMSITTGLDLFRNVPGATVLAVFNASVNASSVLAVSNNADSARVTLYREAASFVLYGGRRLDADSFANTGTSGHALNTGDVWAGRINYQATSAALYKNGTQISVNSSFQTAGNSSDTDSTRIRVGANSSASAANFFAGTISAIVAFRRAVSDAEIRGVSRFLAARANAGILIP